MPHSIKHNTQIYETATLLQNLPANSFVARHTWPSFNDSRINSLHTLLYVKQVLCSILTWHLPDVVGLWLVAGTSQYVTSSNHGLRVVVPTPVVVSVVDDWASRFSLRLLSIGTRRSSDQLNAATSPPDAGFGCHVRRLSHSDRLSPSRSVFPMVAVAVDLLSPVDRAPQSWLISRKFQSRRCHHVGVVSRVHSFTCGSIVQLW